MSPRLSYRSLISSTFRCVLFGLIYPQLAFFPLWPFSNSKCTHNINLSYFYLFILLFLLSIDYTISYNFLQHYLLLFWKVLFYLENGIRTVLWLMGILIYEFIIYLIFSLFCGPFMTSPLGDPLPKCGWPNWN